MPHHQLNQAKAAVRPSSTDIALAAEVILDDLAKTGLQHTENLIEAVSRRFESEPFTSAEPIEGVTETSLRRAKAAGTTIMALAHMEAEGGILPFGERRIHQRPDTTVTYQHGGIGSGYRLGDQFNFSIADVYVLPRWGRALEVEPPSVFLARLPTSMGAKVRRLLREAMDSYRAGTLVGSVILLATASEAAWEQTAARLAAAGETGLQRALADPMTSSARIQKLAQDALARRKLTDGGTLASIEAAARSFRDLRNHAAHEPEHAFDEQLFARSIVTTLLSGATFYFRRLFEMHDRIS